MIYEMKPSRSDGPTAINALCSVDGLIWTAAQDSCLNIWNIRVCFSSLLLFVDC